MKALTLKPSEQEYQSTQKISVDDAKQFAQDAAKTAAEDAANRVNNQNMESFNKFREEIMPPQNQEKNDGSSEGITYEGDGGYSIDTKTEKNLMRRLLDQTLQKALEPQPPSPIESAVSNVMNRVSEGIAEKMLGNIGNSENTNVVKKSSILIDLMNTAFGHGLGENIGTQLPQIIQSLTGAIGQQKTQELVDNLNSKMVSGGNSVSSNSGGNLDSSNVEKQKDMVLALDVNNPDHIKQYATAMGLTQKAAKGMLQIHQDDIINERRSISGGNLNNTNNTEITQALGILIQEMTGMKETINKLHSKVYGESKPNEGEEEIKTDDKWDDEINKASVEVTNKSVTLFQSPIKVDVDDIKGNNDPFFKETPKPPENVTKSSTESESVLEEVKDSNGNSSFKMSGENNISEVHNEIEKPPEVKIINQEVKNDDKKKEVDNERQIEINSRKIKRVVRKPIPVNKELTDHYDIDNNLITEET